MNIFKTARDLSAWLSGNRRDGKQVFYELDGRVEAAEGNSLQVSVDRFMVRVGFPQ